MKHLQDLMEKNKYFPNILDHRFHFFRVKSFSFRVLFSDTLNNTKLPSSEIEIRMNDSRTQM